MAEISTQGMHAVKAGDDFQLLFGGSEKNLSGDHYRLNIKTLPSSGFYKPLCSLMILREEEVSFGNRLSWTFHHIGG